MATHAQPPQPFHHLHRHEPEMPHHRATRDRAPPLPPPKSPPAPKKKKIPMPSPPQVIRDGSRSMSFVRRGFLGEGGFARVYEAIDANGYEHAIKVVAKANLQSKKSKTKLYAEIKLHRALQHPNIVAFEDCFEDEEYVYMTLALCHNGSMNDLLRRRGRYTEPEARFFVLQLIGACHYMHANQVIHRDLKLGNLFLDYHMNVKVGDFGLAALIETPGDRKKTICGTPNYIAPEVLFDTANGHSFEVDTWSIGVIIYTLLIGKPPFQTSGDVKAIYDRIKRNSYEFPSEKPVSKEAESLISQILTPDPRSRPTLHQIADHPFFTRGIFPPSIPATAHKYAPSFSTISRSQSKTNYAVVRRNALLDVETELNVDVAPESDAHSRTGDVSVRQQQKQEREFYKAVQPGSPISALLKSAREPLLVSKSPLRPTENRMRPPANPSNGTIPGPLSSLLAASGRSNVDELLHHRTSTSENRPSVSQVTRKLSTMQIPSAKIPDIPESLEPPIDVPSKKPEHTRKSSKTKSPTLNPTSMLPTLLEEQDEARRQYDLASQKARIVSQMAPNDGEERRLPKERERELHSVPSVLPGKGLDEDETQRIKPIREVRRAGKSSTTSLNGGFKLHGFESVHQTLTTAFNAKDVGIPFREPVPGDSLEGSKVFIQSWVDYCNKYGMGYALTDGTIGVHFNDSTTLVLAPDKRHIEFLSSRHGGAAFVKKHFAIEMHPPELKAKVYLLKHFERYMLDKLCSEHNYTWEDTRRTADLVFVHKYLRMKHVIVFKLSHDVLQFNFFDHTKLIFSLGGLHIQFIDKYNNLTAYTLSSIMEQCVFPPSDLSDDKRRIHNKLLSKISYCREVLQHILSHTPAKDDKGIKEANAAP